MSVPPRDSSKKGTVTRSQAGKNPTLAKENEETSRGPPKPKRKNQENTAKDSHHSETSNIFNQGYLLDISVGSISEPGISISNKSIIVTTNPKSPFFDKLKTFIKPNNSTIIAGDNYNDTPQIKRSFDDTVGDITLREKSIFESITENSTLYDITYQYHNNIDQSGNISNNNIFTTPQKRYESMDPFETKLQLNRTPESFNQTTIFKNPNLEFEQVQETLPNETNQITPYDSANIEQALDSLKFLHSYSTSRKSDKGISANNLPNNNLPIQSTEMTNLPTNQQKSLRDALENVQYFNGSSKVPLTIFMCHQRVNSFLRYSWELRNVVYYDTEECNVKIELRMCL